MTSRFGRNQRRRALQEIAALTAANAALETRVRAAEHRTAHALEEGANRVLRAKYLDNLVQEISKGLERAYGPEINKAAQQLVRSHESRHGRLVDLTATFPMTEMKVMHIHGRINELRYSVAVSDF